MGKLVRIQPRNLPRNPPAGACAHGAMFFLVALGFVWLVAWLAQWWAG